MLSIGFYAFSKVLYQVYCNSLVMNIINQIRSRSVWCISFGCMLSIGFYAFSESFFGYSELPSEIDGYYTNLDLILNSTLQDEIPIILWWTKFSGMEGGIIRHCTKDIKCILTQDRRVIHNPLTKALLFYGSLFYVDDLPPWNGTFFPYWSLLHEESPKNTPVLMYNDSLSLFKWTSTFSRFSDFPLTLQYLTSVEDLTGLKYFKTLEEKNKLLSELAPVLYIQSSCDCPSERDSYVAELMKYIHVDSYGKCLNNRKLPDSLMLNSSEVRFSDEFLHFTARYKFTLAFENGVCYDYITEKLWRPLIVGSVPVYLGSPSVQDWLPNKKSAIKVSDFSSPKKLASYLHKLNYNDSLYIEYFQHKFGKNKITNERLIEGMENKKWSIEVNGETESSFEEHFECFICKNLHENNHKKIRMDYEKDYYCPLPRSPITREVNYTNWWVRHWESHKCDARVLRMNLEKGVKNISLESFKEQVYECMFGEKVCRNSSCINKLKLLF